MPALMYARNVIAYSPELDANHAALVAAFQSFNRARPSRKLYRVSPYHTDLMPATTTFDGEDHSCTCGLGSCFHFKAAIQAQREEAGLA